MKCKLIKREYPYAWLDKTFGLTLNPGKTDTGSLENQDLDAIRLKVHSELEQVLNGLKGSIFWLFSARKIRTIITNYHDSLKQLEDQAIRNLAAYPATSLLNETGEDMVIAIQNAGNVLRNRYRKYLDKPENPEVLQENRNALPVKVLCKLSVDQLGIFLKAADDSKIIIATSMSVIFRLVVPFLSTDKIRHISWNSMRKSTYQMEESDKQAVIRMLEKLIRKIREY